MWRRRCRSGPSPPTAASPRPRRPSRRRAWSPCRRSCGSRPSRSAPSSRLPGTRRAIFSPPGRERRASWPRVRSRGRPRTGRRRVPSSRDRILPSSCGAFPMPPFSRTLISKSKKWDAVHARTVPHCRQKRNVPICRIRRDSPARDGAPAGRRGRGYNPPRDRPPP